MFVLNLAYSKQKFSLWKKGKNKNTVGLHASNVRRNGILKLLRKKHFSIILRHIAQHECFKTETELSQRDTDFIPEKIDKGLFRFKGVIYYDQIPAITSLGEKCTIDDSS